MTKKKKSLKSKDKNSIISGIGLLIFCLVFISILSLRFIQSESSDTDKRYCQDCSLKTGSPVYHSLSDNLDTDEIWCENCNKWHAPKTEESIPSIN